MRLLTRAATAVASLALLPAAAQAATTVDPAATGTCARDATCKTIGEAVAVAQSGDTITVKPGAYAEDVTVPAGKDNLTLDGAAGVALTGSIEVNAAGVRVNRFAVARMAGAEGAIVSTGAGFTLVDSVLVSALGSGIDVAGDATIQRSLLLSTAADGDGVDAVTGAGEHAIKVESSVLVGGAQGAGFAARTTGGNAGPVTVDLRHVTIPGVAMYGILLDNSASGALVGEGGGRIDANITGSIAHGVMGSLARNSTGTGLGGIGANKLIVKFVDNDAQAMFKRSKPLVGDEVESDPAFGPNVDMGTPLNNADSTLFGRNFALLVGSPAIDKGGPLVGEESQTDLGGEPRLSGAATDIGADEFVNVAPVARAFKVEPAAPVSRRPAAFTFDGFDPNQGDQLTYAVDWGDGTPRQTSQGNVFDHLFSQPGTFNVTYTVVDSAGVVSNVITQPVTVGQGPGGGGGGGGGGTGGGGGGGGQDRAGEPRARITSKKLLAKRHELRIRGRASARDGVRRVQVAITRNAGCRQFTGRGFKKRSKRCGKGLRWLTAERSGGRFEYTTNPDVKLPRGKYVLRARAIDTDGTVGKAGKSRPKSLVKLRVK